MSSWKRWVKYGQARLRAAVAEGDAELDRREAKLEAEAADKPWLRSTSPTLDDVRARIEHDRAAAAASATEPTATAPAAREGDPDMNFDLSEQRRQADERLGAIRRELGLSVADDGPAQEQARPGAKPDDRGSGDPR